MLEVLLQSWARVVALFAIWRGILITVCLHGAVTCETRRC